jgi:hypothetical protein
MDKLLAGGYIPQMERAFLIAVAVLAAVAVYRAVLVLVRGEGLLAPVARGRVLPERLMLMIATIAAAGGYAAQCLNGSSLVAAALPAPADWIVWVAGGSQLAFLAGKALRF